MIGCDQEGNLEFLAINIDAKNIIKGAKNKTGPKNDGGSYIFDG